MFWLYLLIMSFFILMPIYSALTDGQAKREVESGTLSKTRMYAMTMALLWTPAVLLLLYWGLGGIDAEHLGLTWQGSSRQWLGVSVLVLLALAAVFILNAFRQNSAEQAKAREVFALLRWMLPENKSQLRWFCLGVSVSAGICEELLYRGFLIHELQGPLGLTGALFASSLLFGLGHVYQGLAGVLRTGATGLVLALAYVASDSLWVAIGLHMLIDVYAGFQAYIVFSCDDQSPAGSAAPLAN